MQQFPDDDQLAQMPTMISDAELTDEAIAVLLGDIHVVLSWLKRVVTPAVEFANGQEDANEAQ